MINQRVTALLTRLNIPHCKIFFEDHLRVPSEYTSDRIVEAITNLGFEQGHVKGRMNIGPRREIQCILDLPNLSQCLEGSIVMRG